MALLQDSIYLEMETISQPTETLFGAWDLGLLACDR
jgi:hypothetical protein